MTIDDKKVFPQPKDLTISQLKDMCAEGDLVPNPDYQRDYVYDNKRASKLIESILIGIPIPAIYLSQENDETFSVIDGQQRVTSFVRYLNNEFSLVGLKELTDLNGLTYKNLDKSHQTKLKNSSLHCICIPKEFQEFKYEIFARLNQGAVSLKPQELRNCLYRGSFNDMLEQLAKNKYLPSLFRDQNNRKSYQERILRFYALREYDQYGSSMIKTMNAYMLKHQNDDEAQIKILKKQFSTTIDIIKQVLGNDAFMAFDRENGKVIEKFSGSVYDSIIIPFSFFNPHDLMTHANKIRTAINNLKRNNEKYREDTYAATGSRKRVLGRIWAVRNLITEITGSCGNDDKNRTFTEDVKKELFHKGYICSYCGNEILSIDDAEVDHIIPFVQGGKTELENAQLLHRHCNREKSSKLDNEDFEDENSDGV